MTRLCGPGVGVVPAAGDELQLRGGLVAAVQLQHGAVPRPRHQRSAAVIPAASTAQSPASSVIELIRATLLERDTRPHDESWSELVTGV